MKILGYILFFGIIGLVWLPFILMFIEEYRDYLKRKAEANQ